MRILEIKDEKRAQRELQKLGADPQGVTLMAPKAVFRAVRLKKVRSVSANILKQEMLSLGGEAATSYGAINLSSKYTPLLITGTLKQFRQLIAKLKIHQFGLPRIAETLEQSLKNYDQSPPPIKIGPRTLRFGQRTYIMGILNVTPDSFSDGGKFHKLEDALSQAHRLIAAGADIIDIGGESTRPGAKNVPVHEELKRVIPVISALRKKKILISIDTRKAAVAEAALSAGAHIINDISALRHDPRMAKVAAKYKVPVILMHMLKNPKTMQKNPVYKDLIFDIMTYFQESLEIAGRAGIKENRLIIDPGFGFGKTVEHNLEILKRLKEFKVLGRPILIGTSRKSTIGKILSLPPGERLMGTAATVAIAISNGVDIIRVHDVAAMKKAAKMTDAIVRRL